MNRNIHNSMGKLLVSLLILSSGVGGVAGAAETNANKMQDKVDDIQTNGKKLARTTKRQVRKADGTDNVFKDAKDKANDTSDDITNDVKKMNRQ